MIALIVRAIRTGAATAELRSTTPYGGCEVVYPIGTWIALLCGGWGRVYCGWWGWMGWAHVEVVGRCARVPYLFTFAHPVD